MREIGGRLAREETDPGDLLRLLGLDGERRGEEHRIRASEERATVDHWVLSQAVCASSARGMVLGIVESGLCGVLLTGCAGV